MLKLILLLSLAQLSWSKGKNWSSQDLSRLYDDLIGNSGYNKLIPPLTGENATILQFSVAPICLEMDEYGVLRGQVWFRYVWEDYRLKYNPEDYNGADVLRINPSQVWTPDLYLYNKRVNSDSTMFGNNEFDSNILIYEDGKVLWVPDRWIEARCINEDGLNLNSVWANQNCTIKFGSWTYDGNLLALELYNNKTEIDMTDYSPHCPTEIVAGAAELQTKYYKCCEEPYESILYNMTLRRKFIAEGPGLILTNPLNGI